MERTAIFSIRTALPDDVADLRDLIECSVRGLQAADYTPAQIEGALGHALGLDTRLVEDETYFVAVLSADPATIVCSGGWSFRSTLFGSDGGPHRMDAPLNPATDAAKIRAIFVHPAWARRGLGSLMLQHCEDAARSAGFSRFEMGATLTGVPLYSLKGYVAFEQVSVPLPNGEALPIVRMRKEDPA